MLFLPWFDKAIYMQHDILSFDPVARVVNFWNTLCGDDELSKDKGKKAKSLQVKPFSIQRTNLFLKHNTAAVFTGNTLFSRIALFSSEYLSHWRKKFYKEVETGSNTPGTSSKTNTGKQWKSLEIMETVRFLPTVFFCYFTKVKNWKALELLEPGFLPAE